MRIDKVYIKAFKNLEDFSIDIDETQWESVFLGQNATGKSNFFEAVVLIFKNIDLKIKDAPPFEYDILYTCKGRKVNIKSAGGRYEFNVWKKFKSGVWTSPELLSRTDFEKRKDDFLPNHIFIYYSGTSERMQNVYIEHQRNYYLDIIKPESKGKKVNKLRRIFLVQNIHSKFAFLSFFIFDHGKGKTLHFLKKELGITDLNSLLLILRKPVWSKVSSDKEMFWNAGGLVRSFLDQLWEYALAPIYNTENVPVSYKSTQSQERLYLYIQDKDQLQKLAKKYYSDSTQFFNALESIYISDLLEDAKVRVEKITANVKIPFSEMSEGEQQLLTVLGMLRFIKDKESLILLDEPDTHLNPIWKWKYLDYFRDYVGRDETTQILINTHDPLVIGGLVKEQIRVFRTETIKGKTTVSAEAPDIDPKGLGVEGILTSELFGLPTTLDDYTKNKLDERNTLIVKQQGGRLTKKDQARLREIFDQLEELGFSKTFRDPLYQKFIIAYKARVKGRPKARFTKEDLENQNKVALEILEEIFKEQKK